MSFEDIPGALDAVKAFEEAEAALKDFEHRYHRDLLVPAVNQLRYAGKHLTRIIAAIGDPGEEVRDAVKHCKRSMYDLHELEVIFLAEVFERFQSDYALIVISDEILPGYNQIVQNFDEAIDFIGAIQDSSREDYYQKCAVHVKTLRASYKTVKAARHPLNALMLQERKKAKQSQLMFIGTVAAVCSAIFALLAI